jgi:hypothetical protein
MMLHIGQSMPSREPLDKLATSEVSSAPWSCG